MGRLIGIDVGGTFTDFVLSGGEEAELRLHKSPSVPTDPAAGVIEGLRGLAELEGRDLAGLLAETSMIVHGTTVTTNAVLTERGAPTGLLTTEGFRDVLEMRRGVRSRTHLYDNSYVAPPPLVPRYMRLPVRERVDQAGNVLQELDGEDARSAVGELVRQGVEAIAICLMHSYANDAHEQELAAIVREMAPACFLSVSSEVLPQVRLYERVSTTAMNSYVGPVLRGYIERLVQRLAAEGFGGVLLVMQSNGGVALPEIVAKLPASTVLSGPAGGPVAGAAYARGAGSEDCLIFDMGGTSYDVSLVREGGVHLTHEGEINRQSVSLPMIDVHTIGAGGGSIGWIDEGGLLHMGPQSAGADPGPVAYGRGGQEPTCTDADVVLGYIDPDYFLGGRMKMDAQAAAEAIDLRIATPLGLSVQEAAAAMYDVINLVMAAGTKDMALARGVDAAELPLVAAGGAGGLHAGMIAQELGVDTVIVPPTSSVLCALGMVLADLRHDYVQAHRVLWRDFDAATARGLIDEMVAQGVEALEHEGVDASARSVRAAADMRYVGQHHEVSVEIALSDLDGDAGAQRIEDAFHARHESLYGFSSPGREMEVIGLRATVLGRREAPDLELISTAQTASSRKGARRAWLPGSRAFAEIDVHDGSRLPTETKLAGPVLVERTTTTVLVPEGFDLSVDKLGSFVLRKVRSSEVAA